MYALVARLIEPFVRVLVPPAGRHRASPAPACPYVCGPTAHRTGERPLRGEDSPLVRPYLLAHERATAPRRVLRLAPTGADLRSLLPCRTEVYA
ncbi:hypothetical protein [Streptomyces sp. S.PNR 29]|uniref:hypothetical protein n=1 Tax=Streptomyces sp. S.PNR 29 TaxID=2973805 RepID=UPI0025AFEDFB|nr:hypothetical protein [Streptomyces sp. S.PNR 29]MDN0196960.1 hypothetical protein [Streptomyces sp. S.PNR 29]